jgi:hypothetical protein
MTRVAACLALAFALAGGACDRGGTERAASPVDETDLPPAERDAETLGREVFELVDRAVDYRGSHRGRPARNLRQMGVDSLTPLTSRYLVSIAREPVITVEFRKAESREITSCRGDSQILEESAINGGRFTLMCSTRSGVQRPMKIGERR